MIKHYIASLTAIGAALLTLFGVVFKKYIDHKFNQIESAQQQNFDSQRDIIQHNFDKQKLTYNQLQLERHQVIKALYQKLARVELDMIQIISPGQFGKITEEAEKERKNALFKDLNQLLGTFWENKLYFTAEIQISIESLIHDMQFLFWEYCNIPSNDWKEKRVQWEKLQTDIKASKTDLEEKLQILIGIESEVNITNL